jgi:AraC-like DNA-binding protein
MVVQGEKKLSLNEEIFQYGVAQYLVMPVDLPLSVCMIEATPDQPYLGLKLKLDPVQLCEIIAQTNPDSDRKENSIRGWCVSDANLSLLDCVIRLVNLLETPQDIPFLAPMMIREIYYRLLTDRQGEAVRQVATAGSNMQRIAGVIRQIKAEFTQPLRVEDLAEQANMSTASFHRHFKAVTSMSPLQYQKQLRLLTARQMMLAEAIDATQAAYHVGYESTSQFSREYARMFGAPPIRDIERLRTTETVLSR